MSLLALWITTFGVCVAGAIVPFINTEIYLVSVSAISPHAFVGPLVVAASVGQMVGKVAMFYAGRGVLHMGMERVRRPVESLRQSLDERPIFARALLLSSALVGLPPLYVVSVACGTIGMSVVTFFVIGLAGRLVHFAVVALIPQYARMLIG
ncbi:MAG TPA: VTT domain-containing protein [Longimicrobiaceae bacterium]